MTELRKMMLVNLLGRRFGLKSYLEVATPSTGRFYAEVDRGHFAQCARLMYLTPFMFDDGLTVDFRSPDEDISGLLEDIHRAGYRIDISLIDGWHTYAHAHRDLVQFFDLLNDGGFLVVHDCLPATRAGATPRFQRGAWWGMTYKAFLDVVLQTPSLDYVTLDCDHGCGLIVKNRSFATLFGPAAGADWLPPRPDAELVNRWRALGQDFDAAYDLFEVEHKALLRLVPAERFLALFPEAMIAQSRSVRAPLNPRLTPPRPSLDKRLLRYLQGRLAAMTADKRR